jgi:hypothetical protein
VDSNYDFDGCLSINFSFGQAKDEVWGATVAKAAQAPLSTQELLVG